MTAHDDAAENLPPKNSGIQATDLIPCLIQNTPVQNLLSFVKSGSTRAHLFPATQAKGVPAKTILFPKSQVDDTWEDSDDRCTASSSLSIVAMAAQSIVISCPSSAATRRHISSTSR